MRLTQWTDYTLRVLMYCAATEGRAQPVTITEVAEGYDHALSASGGKIVLISDAKGLADAGEGCMATIEMPEVHPLIAPMVYAVPVQLLAYHVAVVKGADVDQPRNLAKSVTVE